MVEELTEKTEELLEKTGSIYIGLTETEKRMSYFLSKGTGMELWERLKSEGFTPEELEKAKNELKRKNYLTVRKFEALPPYYFRFRGKLARITEYREHKEDGLNTGHADIRYTETTDKLFFKEGTLRKEGLEGTERKIVEKALEIHQKRGKDKEEAIDTLPEDGISQKTLEKILKDKEEIDEKDITEKIDEMEEKSLLDIRTEKRERQRPVWFVSDWEERGEKKTRFFFSPEIYRKYLEKEI